jgi:hypothetical protein
VYSDLPYLIVSGSDDLVAQQKANATNMSACQMLLDTVKITDTANAFGKSLLLAADFFAYRLIAFSSSRSCAKSQLYGAVHRVHRLLR